MSDMIINDSVPVDKKWGELIKYNIFIMKIIEFVVAFVLMTLPILVEPVENFHCIASAPTLLLSLFFLILYVVDQAQMEAESYYLVFQMVNTAVALLTVIGKGVISGAIYGLFYLDQLVALSLDLYYGYKERGWKF